jgi:hypothetical protein
MLVIDQEDYALRSSHPWFLRYKEGKDVNVHAPTLQSHMFPCFSPFSLMKPPSSQASWPHLDEDAHPHTLILPAPHSYGPLLSSTRSTMHFVRRTSILEYLIGRLLGRSVNFLQCIQHSIIRCADFPNPEYVYSFWP